MKLFLALCALVAVAAVDYYPPRDAPAYVNDIFDVKPARGYYDSFEDFGPRKHHGKKHHRHSDSSSDSSSDSDSDSSSGSNEGPSRTYYKKVYRPTRLVYGPASDDAPANSAYGAPVQSPPGYGNTYDRK